MTSVEAQVGRGRAGAGAGAPGALLLLCVPQGRRGAQGYREPYLLAVAVPPAAAGGPVSAEAPVCAEPTQLRLAPAFLPWSVLATRQLPLPGWEAASALLVPAGGAGGRWALGRLGAVIVIVVVVWHTAGHAAGWQCQAGENHPGLLPLRLFYQMCCAGRRRCWDIQGGRHGQLW